MRAALKVAGFALGALGAWASAGLGQDASLTGDTALKPASEEAYRALVQLYQYDGSVPLGARVVARESRDLHTREKVVFTGARGMRVPAYLGLPAGAAGPYPVVLLVHALTSSKEAWWSEESFERGWLVARALLESGVAVFALDAPLHGERSYANDHESAWALFEQGRWTGLRDMMVDAVLDARRGLDYLVSRPEIDGDRIAVLGYSMGGAVTYILSAVDGRTAASAAVAPWTVDIGDFRWDAGFDASAVLTYNFAPRIVDQPFLLVMGTADPNYTVAEAEVLARLTPGTQLVLYDSDHRMPERYAGEVTAWLLRALSR